MNSFDIVIIGILCFCLVRGFFRGFVKEISSIVGVFSGIYAAFMYYRQVADILSRIISNQGYLYILSCIIIFCIVFFTITTIGTLIKFILKIAFLGWVDRIFGVCFGIIKGVLIISFLLIVLTTFLPDGVPIIKNSILLTRITFVSETIVCVIPKEMKQTFRTKIKGFKKLWKK